MVRTIIKRKFQLLVLLAGLGLMALAACGSDTPAASPGEGQEGQQAAADELVDLVGSQLGQSLVQEMVGGAANPRTSSSAGIWVNGQGQASAEPDLAILSLGVEAFADTVAEARSNAASRMNDVLQVLRTRAVADRDIQTRSFNIHSRQEYFEVTECPAQGQCFERGQSMVVGFEVTNRLTVTVRDLDSLSEIIDEVIEAGGDLIRFQGVRFAIEDTQELEDQARALAMEDLERKAAHVAGLAGVELGQLLFVTETGGRGARVIAEETALAIYDASTPISAGELDVVVNIIGAFDIEEPAP